MLAQVVLATPESASDAAHVLATVWSAAYGLALPVYVTVGGVVSTRMSMTVALARLPALSATVPLADWWSPSVSVMSDGQLATPESASAQVKWTTTFSLDHVPVVYGAPESFVTDAEIVGAVRSTLMPVKVALAALPARSVAVPTATWLSPWPNVASAGQVAIFESVSAQSK